MLSSDLYCDDCGQGLIFQDPVGAPAGGPPNGALLGLPGFEALEFDTFVTLGSVTADNPGGPAAAAHRWAVPLILVGNPAATFSDGLLDVTWSPAGGATFPIPTRREMDWGELMARVTLNSLAARKVTCTLLLQDASGSSGAV